MKTTTVVLGILLAGEMPATVAAEHGDYTSLYRRMLNDERFTIRSYRVMKGDFPISITDCDAWLVSGSSSSAYDNHAWIRSLEAFLRDAYKRRMPIVGVCFGHQVLAKALGGRVQRQKGGFLAGVRRYHFLDTTLPLVAAHGDQVTVPPPGAVVVASAPYCPNAALRYGDIAFSIQPHPEYSPTLLADLVKELSTPDVHKDAKACIGMPVMPGRVVQIIKDFLLQLHHRNALVLM